MEKLHWNQTFFFLQPRGHNFFLLFLRSLLLSAVVMLGSCGNQDPFATSPFICCSVNSQATIPQLSVFFISAFPLLIVVHVYIHIKRYSGFKSQNSSLSKWTSQILVEVCALSKYQGVYKANFRISKPNFPKFLTNFRQRKTSFAHFWNRILIDLSILVRLKKEYEFTVR